MSLGSWITLLGFIVGGAVYLLAGLANGRERTTEFKIATAGLVFGVLGAKLSQWITTSDGSIQLSPAGFLLSGRSLLGGFVCGWLGVELAKRRLGVKTSTGLQFALAIPAGEAVGRIGCYLNGCCYGTECAQSWAVFQHGAWRHPSQLYLSLSAGAIFAMLIWASRRYESALLFPLFLVLFGFIRFFVEFFRERTILFANISLAQLVALEIGIAGILLLKLRLKHATA